MPTETLRPNGAGNQQGWNAEGGDYTRVDEVTSDGDTTRLYSPTDDAVATFAMDNSGVGAGTINSVTVYINTRGLDPISNTVQLAVRTGGTDYFSPNQTYNNTSYHEESYTWTTNPNTTSAWTWSEIDSLEAGMKRIGGGGQAVTQVWVVVDYTTATIEQEGFRFRNDDGSESTATWLAAQDTNVSLDPADTFRLRLLVNTTGSAGALQYKLQYRKNAGAWGDVALNGSSFSGDLTTGGTASASHENQPSEGSDEAFDNSSSTKWLAFNTTPWLKYQFPSSETHIVTKYAITSGNDDDTRDPKDWTLEGSNDNTNWTTVDTVTGETFASRGLRKEFICDAPGSTAYEYYRLNISSNNGNGSITQLAELEMYEDNPLDVEIYLSSNITTSGEATTAQLTAPSGKTTSDFDAGRIQDDENPADSVTIGTDDYSELEWSLGLASGLTSSDYYEFRLVYGSSTTFNTYTVTPRVTIASASVRRVFVVS